MSSNDHIPIEILCQFYGLDSTFIISLGEMGLIELESVEETYYVHEDQIQRLERMIRMHHELRVNQEGIDIIFNLLDKINALQSELKLMRSKLKLYED